MNLLHTAVHLAIGAWGIMAWRGMASPHMFARSLAVLYGVLAVMGLLPGLNTVFGLIPLHGHDVWLHAVTAAVAAYFGWRTAALPSERRINVVDRRHAMRPIVQEPGLGLADRRRGAFIGAM